MKKFIKKYQSMTFEEKTIFSTRFSCVFNTILAVGKIALSIFQGIFFLIAGIINILIMLSKLECFLGVKNYKQKPFEERNNMIGIYLILSGLAYAIYMGRLIFTDVEVMEYSMFLGINIAFVSFVELGIAIKGMFNAYGKGHYYRNIKIINLCSAFTAMVLTEIAITSFATEADTRIIDGIFGMCVGGIIILLAGFILVAPKISVVDKEHNIYKNINNKNLNSNTEFNIQLTNSKLFGNYYYKAKVSNGIVDGHIVQEKSPIKEWNIYIKILIIVLSEILIFVYGVWGLVYYFKNYNLVDKLDLIMKSKGYEKIYLYE